MSACQCIISGHGYTELQLTLTLQRNAHVATGLLQCSTSHITSDGNSASFKTLTAPRAKLRIPVQAQPSTRRTGLRSPTRLGMRQRRDLGLPNEYRLRHCGLSAASRHKLAFTSRHLLLLTATWHGNVSECLIPKCLMPKCLTEC